MTHDVKAQIWATQEYNWKDYYELSCHCRDCRKTSVFIVSLTAYAAREKFDPSVEALVNFKGSLNPIFEVERHVSLRDQKGRTPPEHLPQDILKAFNEGAACLAIGCCNAAACMFRLCVDLGTRPLLPDPMDGTKARPNEKQRRDLGLRLAWLFDNGILPEALRELAKCIREDANDGAHVGTLNKADAEDLVEFTERLLNRLITEPKQLELAQFRREERRSPKSKGT